MSKGHVPSVPGGEPAGGGVAAYAVVVMLPLESVTVRKHGSRFEIAQLPPEKHLQAGAPVAPETGSTSPTQGPHWPPPVSPMGMHTVIPSLQSPSSRFTRRPVQQATSWPASGQEQPGRFLSSGHCGVPPGMGGGMPPPSQLIGGGSFRKNCSSV